MTKPIKPSDIVSVKPDEVVEIFNQLILENWDGVQAMVKAGEAAKRIVEQMNITFSDVYEKKYLDIEEMYRQSGWHVTFDKPGYNERHYDPFFTFSKKGSD